MTPKEISGLSDEALKTAGEAADKRLAVQVKRMRRIDPQFREALANALAIEDEMERR